MAKDVDLSSKEWTDVIFEGKNKEFGAYELRRQSDGRHNRAMLFVIIGLIFVLIGGYFWSRYSDYRREQRELQLQAEMEQMLAQMEADAQQEEEQQPEEEIPQAVEEPVAEEALPEEILNTIKDTEIAIAADEEVTEDITSKDEVAESTAAAGASTFDQGTDDLNVVREHKEEIIVEEKHEPVKEEIFTAVEQMPQFPGGEAELLKYIATHIKYPTMAAENNIQGRVVVKFVVKKDGQVGDVVVVRGKDPDLDKEAVRVVKTLPKFIPGKMNGQAVSVWYTLPINFKLQS
ncbi:MAG: energy transducer TonB [Muribaculaceae bacterium]|nr:energy transducer TonB [Muribaculaceae bacterium]